MLENSVLFNNLLAWYGKLLTDKQRGIMINYYQEDLSLSEIASLNDISRSAVHDTIKRSEELLLYYESTLEVYKKFELRHDQYRLLRELDIEEVSKIVSKLEEIE